MKYVEWGEPRPGLEPDGDETTCHLICRMTVEDAIKVQRNTHEHYRYRADWKPLTAEELLEEFMVVNWATVLKEVPDGS